MFSGMGLWGSLVSFQLRELETPVQIRADPLVIALSMFHCILKDHIKANNDAIILQMMDVNGLTKTLGNSLPFADLSFK